MRLRNPEKSCKNFERGGNEIRWIESEIMTNEDGEITGTFCQYRAEEKEMIHEHADRAGLPATRVDRRGEPLEGE